MPLDFDKVLSVMQKEESQESNETPGLRRPRKRHISDSFIATTFEELGTAPPKAFKEPKEKPYTPDEIDKLFEENPSFVTDFMNLGRAVESPSLFLVWGALWTISSALNRNAWLSWYPRPMYPNIYVIFVANAGVCKKSTPLEIGSALLMESQQNRLSNLDEFANEYRIITSKSSPEGLFLMLKPEEKSFLDPKSVAPISVTHDSKVAICISELATFLGKQQYNTGLINLLTDLYDCKDEDAEVTRSRGMEKLTNIYVTLAGAITPTGLRESVPEEALSGGFLSRTIPVYQETPSKIYSRPQRLTGYPQISDIAPKLAWIANNCRGEYTFSPEAEEAFDKWYRGWKAQIISDALLEHESRKDVHIRKVSMLLRVADYSESHVIEKKHFMLAEKLVSFTLRRANKVIAEVTTSEFIRQLESVEEFIQKRHTVSRKELVSRFSRNIRVDELNLMLTQLKQAEIIRITLDKQELNAPSSVGRELYSYSSHEILPPEEVVF
ncbi:TPA_asm: DNA primase [Caudoviricetes sp. vir526]|jgi:hypothetical protein|nr:TPA_asm: DNA primase [Caudoviricetes sp. vir526]